MDLAVALWAIASAKSICGPVVVAVPVGYGGVGNAGYEADGDGTEAFGLYAPANPPSDLSKTPCLKLVV